MGYFLNSHQFLFLFELSLSILENKKNPNLCSRSNSIGCNKNSCIDSCNSLTQQIYSEQEFGLDLCEPSSSAMCLFIHGSNKCLLRPCLGGATQSSCGHMEKGGLLPSRSSLAGGGDLPPSVTGGSTVCLRERVHSYTKCLELGGSPPAQAAATPGYSP